MERIEIGFRVVRAFRDLELIHEDFSFNFRSRKMTGESMQYRNFFTVTSKINNVRHLWAYKRPSLAQLQNAEMRATFLVLR